MSPYVTLLLVRCQTSLPPNLIQLGRFFCFCFEAWAVCSGVAILISSVGAWLGPTSGSFLMVAVPMLKLFLDGCLLMVVYVVPMLKFRIFLGVDGTLLKKYSDVANASICTRPSMCHTQLNLTRGGRHKLVTLDWQLAHSGVEMQ